MTAQTIAKRTEDYSRWYTDVIREAELADYAPVKGCMIIRPWGFAIWERIRDALDAMIKETGHQNAYFPLLIPESLLTKEAEHVEGFSPECAVVTHGGGKVLEEPLYIRPTSEAIICSTYAKWMSSWRDLPILINQWANVVRWEMRTRLFLRTTEFLWQEGHTAHETEAEAREEVARMLEVYRRLAEDVLAMPVVPGIKSRSETFAGAVETYAIEAMMQDRRALQAGTSHFLGQNFAKAYGMQFQGRGGALELAWSTSWGVSTRLIGGLIMCHSDDAGLVLPPSVAPVEVVIVPIYHSDDDRSALVDAARKVGEALKGAGLRAKVDDRDHLKPGAKFFEWEKKGVPVRLEIGPRDLAAKSAVAVRRDLGKAGKRAIPFDGLPGEVAAMLAAMQQALFAAARDRREKYTFDVPEYGPFKDLLNGDLGFVRAGWCGNAACEAKVKEETTATIRVIPADGRNAPGKCVVCGTPSTLRPIFARSY
ncbi:MAG: proline--tRNA ligase [Planctomycetes bacterium]|jgi:prolyl-tRNA synthetase|nr:proline--tRNA ligase [Planctomycetota bacterium]